MVNESERECDVCKLPAVRGPGGSGWVHEDLEAALAKSGSHTLDPVPRLAVPWSEGGAPKDRMTDRIRRAAGGPE